MKIKNLLKFIIPKVFLTPLREFYLMMNLKKFYKNDYKHLKTSSKNNEMEKIRLLGNITKLYHRIEKGLAYNETIFKYGFGKRNILELIKNLNIYYKKKFDLNNIRFITALSVLNSYITKHKNSSIDLLYIKETLTINLENFVDKGNGGVTNYKANYIIQKSKSNFLELSQNRHSVRFFSSIPPKIDKIINAIKIAQKTPSVCNRQGWKVHLITDKKLIELFRTLHNVFSLQSQNLTSLILITFQKNYFSYPLERNQGFIDGGLFSMSLLYALTYEGLATCALNANLTLKAEKLLRESLKISILEGFIMFIAVGNYTEEFVSPNSFRDTIKETVVVH